MKLLFLAFIVFLTACTAPDSATNALKQAGYINITIEGYALFGCSEDDMYHTKFSATGPTGVRATGVVCSAMFKGSTIRLD